MKKICFLFLLSSIHTKDVAGLAQSVELLTGDGEVEESIPGTESKLKFFLKNEKLRLTAFAANG